MSAATALRTGSPTIAELVRRSCAGRLIGVEREYEVYADGHGDAEPVDARTVWPQLTDPGWAIDPGDRNARRGATGAVITTDGRHAEIATPPVALGPGSVNTVLAHAAAAERHLAGRLGARRLVGYSTHISVETDDRVVVKVARFIASRMSIPLMLMLDRQDSPGLLVRPRPGRLEIGGEFAAGDQLRSAIAMTVATVLLAERRLGVRRVLAVGASPAVRPARAVERFGWYVDRTAFGTDLYTTGRDTVIGGRSAQELLRRHWSRCRGDLLPNVDATELALVDAAVSGNRPLPLELAENHDGPVPEVPAHRHYGERVRGPVTVRVTAATWWKALLELDTGQSRRWLTLPGRSLDAVLDALDLGLLDAELAGLCTGPSLDWNGVQSG